MSYADRITNNDLFYTLVSTADKVFNVSDMTLAVSFFVVTPTSKVARRISVARV